MADWYSETVDAEQKVFARAQKLQEHGIDMAALINAAMAIRAPMWKLVEEAERQLIAEGKLAA